MRPPGEAAAAGASSGDELLVARQSAYQRIELWRDAEGELELTLDRAWQFREREEVRFHAFLADLPACLAPRLQRVLILGGGDGLAARNLLRYPGVKRIELVELDPEVLALCREHPQMRRLNADALNDPRVELHVADARAFLTETSSRSFDLIVCDFPAPTHPELEALFTSDFYASLLAWLQPEGVVCIQASCPPAEFARVLTAVETHFPWTLPLLCQLDPTLPDAESDAWANFIVASRGLRRPQRSSANPDEPFDAARIAAHRIRKSSTSGFETEAYGRLPVFGELPDLG